MALDPITAGIDLASSVIKRIWPNPADQAKAKQAMQALQQSGELQQMATEAGLVQGQLGVNKAEASTSLSGFFGFWVAGWRPGIGWICGAAFAWVYVLQPFLEFGLTAAGHPVKLPTVDLTNMTPVLLGMLGLGSMRSFEKVKKVSNDHG